MSEVKVLLLRGVNVAGANRLPMPEFRQMLLEQGLQQVHTHLQSGNVVYLDPGVEGVESKITAAMKQRFGFAPPMFVMTLAEYDAILKANPYKAQGAADGAAVHTYFLASPASASAVAALSAHAANGEQILFTDKAVYLLAPNGIGRSVLAIKLESGLTMVKTARNQTSTTAIATLARTITV
ncbi:hypothetical protein GCM10010873_38830 [Cypionkella aquatica]|uniref:DUF1697 domain-containing protein n=1 Tax=Cypionkella aquatica TaxID=1756042 RepID=A0AA37X3N6_9RHOB|nr:DUF1697 domain-containing protein [Cypionkella aquatica]GLS88909.1 hypothetical protein GCM10010873_38830 [Cypionkella aquatica]